MQSEPTANGADRRDPSQRPDWYVPIAPVEDDGRTVQDLLRALQVVAEPGDIPDDLRADLNAFLDRYGSPRERA